MNQIFDSVYRFLKWVSKISGFTYHEINVIVYFIIIPAVFIYLIGRLFKTKIPFFSFLIFVVLACIFIPNFSDFSSALFQKSVDFLNWFNVIGLNYVQASVVICVILPILIVIVLLFLKKKRGIKPFSGL